jgi:hypothetical protein
MDIERYFGKAVAEKMRSPAYEKDGTPKNSQTVQDFYRNMHRLITKGDPFIYALDSQDALESNASRSKFDKQMRAAAAGEKEVGSMGDGKAKYHSENIRWVQSGLRRTGSILIIIGHVRDNLNPFSFEKKTRSGGKALIYYANTQIWTSLGKKIKRSVRGVQRTVGVYSIAEVKKNRITGKIGKDRSVPIPILYGHGIDDIASCVGFMIKNKMWKKGEGDAYRARQLGFTGTYSEIIQFVEKSNAEEQLRTAVGEAWAQIEKECEPDRKRRYE